MSEVTSLDFAGAITGRSEIRLYKGQTNELGPPIAWPVHVPTEPFAVHVANLEGHFRTVAIDLDATKGGDPSRDSARIQEILAAADVRWVESLSGPTGGRHLLFTLDRWAPSLAVKLFASNLGDRIESLDRGPMVSGRGSAIRPPLAPHRHGGFSVPTSDVDVALTTLLTGNDVGCLPHLLSLVGVEEWRIEAVTTLRPSPFRLESLLSDRILGVLLGTRVKDWGDSSPSGVIRSLLIAMVNAGMSWGEIASLMYDRAADSARRKRHRGEPLDFLRRQYLDALDFVRERPAAVGPNEIRIELHHVGEVAGAIAWKGRPGLSELAVLQALLKIGISVGRREVSAGVRQLAADTTLNETTVSRALARLGTKKWIRRTAVGHGTLASTFRLADPPTEALAEYHTKHRTGGRMPSVALSGQILRTTQHDAFRHHPGTWRCFSHLDLVEPATATQIAASLGVHPSTARTHLSKLHKWEMAERLPAGWVRLDRDLDDLAEERGTLGMVDEQRQRHEAERDRYREGHRRSRRIDTSTGEILGGSEPETSR